MFTPSYAIMCQGKVKIYTPPNDDFFRLRSSSRLRPYPHLCNERFRLHLSHGHVSNREPSFIMLKKFKTLSLRQAKHVLIRILKVGNLNFKKKT